MQQNKLTGHRTQQTDDSDISFPPLESWNPLTKRYLQTPLSDRPCILSGSMNQHRERWTNEGDSMNMKVKVKVNEPVHDKGCAHAISER